MNIERLSEVPNKSTCAITHDAVVAAWHQDMIKGIWCCFLSSDVSILL